MVVVCTSCQARFRVADEKVGPRGARVRCTKCKTVFQVGPPPARDQASAPAAVPPAPPPMAPTPPPSPRGDDPFASAVALDLHGPASPAPRDAGDPFAAFAAASGKAASIPEPTPFPDGALPEPTPIAPAGPPARRKHNGAPASTLDEFLGSLPVTNLADLALTPARKPAGAPSTHPGLALEERTPIGIPVDAEPAAIPDPEPYPAADPGPASFEGPDSATDAGATPSPAALAVGAPGPAPGPGTAIPLQGSLPEVDEWAGAQVSLDADLHDLVDRMPGVPPRDEAPEAAAEPAPAAVAAEAPSEALADDATPPRPGSTPPREARAPVARTRPGAAPSGVRGEEPGPVEGDVLGSGRLHGVLVNAVSLALLLVLTVAILLWWRGGSALGLLGVGGGAATGLLVERTTNGYYDTDSGRPVVFLRGDVTARGTAPAGRVRVRAEMVRGGRVLASAEGTAGGVPTPEELAGVGSREDEARLRAQLAARAPARPEVGQALPFVVTFVDAPADLGGVTFRVVAEAAPRP